MPSFGIAPTGAVPKGNTEGMINGLPSTLAIFGAGCRETFMTVTVLSSIFVDILNRFQ